MRTRLALTTLAGSTACLLRKAERDSETLGRLSPRAAATGWALYLAHAALTLAASRRPSRPLPVNEPLAVVSGGALALFGSWLFAMGVREFRSFEQMSGLKKGRIVTSGPYRFSRNPQIVGWGGALLGVALAGRSLKTLLLVAAFFFVHRLHFGSEERHLERTFGEEYRRYKVEVPRLFSLGENG